MISLQLVRMRYKCQGAGELKNALKSTFWEQILRRSLRPRLGTLLVVQTQTALEESCSWGSLAHQGKIHDLMFVLCNPQIAPDLDPGKENATGKMTAGALWYPEVTRWLRTWCGSWCPASLALAQEAVLGLLQHGGQKSSWWAPGAAACPRKGQQRWSSAGKRRLVPCFPCQKGICRFPPASSSQPPERLGERTFKWSSRSEVEKPPRIPACCWV